MRKATRLSVLIMALMFAVVGAAGPASAHVTQLDIKESAVIQDDDSVIVSGTITCTAGEIWQVRVQLEQKDASTGEVTFRSSGRDKGTCTGDPQQWQVRIEDPFNQAQEGEAVVTAIARTFVAGSQHGPAVKRVEQIEVKD